MWRHWRILALVAALEVVVLGGTAIYDLFRHVQEDALDYLLLAIVAGAVGLAPISRLAPLGVALAATLLYAAHGQPMSGPLVLGITAALLAPVRHDLPQRSLALGVLTVAAVAAADVIAERTPTAATQGLGMAIWVTVVLSIAHVWASRRAYVAAIRERAELAEQTREAEARRRVSEERLRIARELHDVISHSISVINVQAGAALHVIDEGQDRPERVREALQTIRTTSKETLSELRGLLGVLRRVDEPEPLDPSPGLAQLDTLVETASGAGLRTEVEVHGQPRPLPPAVDAAAYRIVQEGLTNALRHGRAATALVTLAYDGARMDIEITDDGAGAGGEETAGAGHGLTGMRERAAAVGGVVEAGPRPDRGFRVHARLPL